MNNIGSTSQIPDMIEQIQLGSTAPYEQYPQAAQNTQAQYQDVLQAVVIAMNQLQGFASGRQENNMIVQFRDYAERLLAIPPPHTAEDQFCHLYALRKWIFWIPSTVLKGGQPDYLTLIFLAYLYAMSLAVEPLFPEVAGPLVAALSLQPLEKLMNAFEGLDQQYSSTPDTSNILSLIHWPRQVLASYKERKFQTTYGSSMMSRSPVGFDIFSSDLTQATETFSVPQRSPAFAPSHASSTSVSSAWSSGSAYLDLPILGSNSPVVGRSYTTSSIPSMSSGYDPNEALFTESQFDYNTGFVYSPSTVWA